MSANPPARPKIAVVGAGPAGLMAAEVLAQGGAAVTIFDQMAAPGRKFLLAGRGGLNLTHSEEFERFLTRYGDAAAFLRPAIESFSQENLRAWSAGLGEDTFIGTSGRVFPASFKASPLLRAWLKRLDALGVRLLPRHHWIGWDEAGSLRFATPDGTITETAAATVLALGGASWPRLGSDGAWTKPLAAAGIGLAPLRPANCGFGVAWTDSFRERFAGAPIKGSSFSFADKTVRGDAVVTGSGIEGGAIYALSALLREAVMRDGAAVLRISLRPDLATEDIEARLRRHAEAKQKLSLANLLRKALKLSPLAIGLLHEASLADHAPLSSLSLTQMAQLIASVPVRLVGVAPISRAISTAGGILLDEADENFMLRRMPGVFVAGEMLDWEAPTGGYLLQACFATGAAAGRAALEWASGKAHA
ncbi:MAG: TIGR03862 family flavoprotein [Beijerinckiaceae bacterium]|nr:MAG: TIGR03862 family flavoprotein [Beijerinckiaceae bacterium]